LARCDESGFEVVPPHRAVRGPGALGVTIGLEEEAAVTVRGNERIDRDG